MGTMSTLRADSSTSTGVGIPSLADIGAGFLYQAMYYPVLAPLPIAQNAHAMALFSFCRVFAGLRLARPFAFVALTLQQVWDVSVGTAVLQTQRTFCLPRNFMKAYPELVAVAYSISAYGQSRRAGGKMTRTESIPRIQIKRNKLIEMESAARVMRLPPRGCRDCVWRRYGASQEL
ncbi:hypothetical protein PsYK624_161730 [Phanerochaete sordida]|uniref:Uncharacterized protein n=1 Tax=Phanerochaete sordida TaxID=48140 RepID=A0A9P3LLM7_9APHY|nr:hypothetical protein PsYK624_161730 [Phanerochaete sordida]